MISCYTRYSRPTFIRAFQYIWARQVAVVSAVESCFLFHESSQIWLLCSVELWNIPEYNDDDDAHAHSWLTSIFFIKIKFGAFSYICIVSITILKVVMKLVIGLGANWKAIRNRIEYTPMRGDEVGSILI